MIIEKLAKLDVVIFDLDEEKLFLNVMEACDLNMSIDLCKSDLKQFIDELQEIHDSMEEITKYLPE